MITVTEPYKVPEHNYYISLVKNEYTHLISIRIIPVFKDTYKVILRHPSGILIQNIEDTTFGTLKDALDAGKQAAAHILRCWASEVEAS